MEDMFEDVAIETVRDVPEEYNKPDYYARKTCNYLTAVLQVFHQIYFPLAEAPISRIVSTACHLLRYPYRGIFW